jgi:hypothetical protein
MEKYCKIRERWDKHREVAAQRLKWILNTKYWILNTESWIYLKNSKLSEALLFCLISKVCNWKGFWKVMEWSWSFHLRWIKSWFAILKQMIFWTLQRRHWVTDIDEPLQEFFGVRIWNTNWILIVTPTIDKNCRQAESMFPSREPARCESQIRRTNNKCLYHFLLFRSEHNHSLTNPAA